MDENENVNVQRAIRNIQIVSINEFTDAIKSLMAWVRKCVSYRLWGICNFSVSVL